MTTPESISKTMERGTLALFVAAAAVIGLLLLLPPLRQIAHMAGGRTPVGLLTDAEVPHVGSAGGAGIESATFESAWVIATGLSDSTRGLVAAGVGFGALTAAITAGAVAYFFLLLLWKRPFHRSLVVATQIAGSALLLGSLLSGGLGGLGRMMAASELNPIAGDVFLVAFSFEPGVLLAGVAVLALSFVFGRGQRLQRDTEGLI
ncbi:MULTISPECIES: hypothetical protein [unclassified Microbacterium]|uniref:hypothetical protein n=1 Tax=unclassified Microbacterium TaxID=2609290 RepID=UPI00214B9CA6|nr:MULTISPECIES: hypothetical protein [unclassified Microbacterium]MCR2808128.1 hypothetical protein [Microbacterium sp. zg.B185]WIM19406.1 hypothetical protein QNO12_00935 [Microbacterium sp. zg-B185]